MYPPHSSATEDRILPDQPNQRKSRRAVGCATTATAVDLWWKADVGLRSYLDKQRLTVDLP